MSSQALINQNGATHAIRRISLSAEWRHQKNLADFSEIHCLGNTDLLNSGGVGFCGARNTTEKGLSAAADCARQTVQKGLTVVSGYARGVDSAVHAAALKEGGRTIAVLAEGLNHFRIRPELKAYWDWRRILIVSQFPENAIWKIWRAMQRNKLIIRLSQAMVVIEAREKGGTANAGETSLAFNVPLYVLVYQEQDAETAGNRILLQKGAARLMKSRSRNQANMKPVFNTISAQEKPESNRTATTPLSSLFEEARSAS